jgi:hypothetical protein
VKRSEIKRKTPLRAKKGLKRAWIRPKPKQGRKQAIADADQAIKAITLARCGGKCEFPDCNRRASTNHHIIHCRNYVLRWQEKNNMGICAYHHDWEGQADHCVEFAEGEIQWLGGQEAYDALRLEGNTGTSEEPEDAIRRLSEGA